MKLFRLVPKAVAFLVSTVVVGALPVSALPLASAGPPALPTGVPIRLVGDPEIDGARVGESRAPFALGQAAELDPLESVGAYQESTVERVRVAGREVLRRSSEVKRPGSDQVLMRASIDLDPRTLAPLTAQTEQGGNTVRIDYDWDRFVMRRTPGADGSEYDETALDIAMFEVGAHDVWMAALPLREGFAARLPAIFGATGTKYWAVPRVVGSEPVDLGDGKSRDAWIVELDWWGMGAGNTAENHSLGGGEGGTAGAGGMYWVLKNAAPGAPRVVRVRTEATPEVDSVVELRLGQ